MPKDIQGRFPSFSRIIAGVMNWGTWGAKLSKAEMATLISQCVENGITTFDHADIYGGYTTEAEFGKALKQSAVKREKIQLISKCGICYPCKDRPEYTIKHYNTSRDHIIKSVDRTLQNLKTDYLDLLLLHRPSPLMFAEEIADTLQSLKEMGKVRSFGVSNFNPGQADLILSKYPIVANQVEASLLHLDPFFNGCIDHCQCNELLPLIWSPLAGGKLFHDQDNPEIENKKQRLLAVCNKYDWTLTEASYLFLLHHPYTLYPVVGSSKIDRIKMAKAALDKSLTDSQWFELLEAARGYKVA